MTTYTLQTEEDILQSGCEGLVNPVNCVGVMGKGLALHFKHAFPAMFAAYERACRNNEVQLGRVHIFSLQRAEPPFFVLNFPTKNHWKQASRKKDITVGLTDLARVVQELRLKTLAVPALGCGLGGLSWTHVGPEIVRKLHGIDGLHVMLFPPRSQ